MANRRSTAQQIVNIMRRHITLEQFHPATKPDERKIYEIILDLNREVSGQGHSLKAVLKELLKEVTTG